MIETRPFRDEDYEAIQDAVEPFAGTKDVVGIKDRGVSITATDGDVMACGGILYTSDTEGLAWMKISKGCKHNAFTWARTIREVFSLMVKATELNVFTYVIDGFEEGDRLARAIGLSKTDEKEEHNGKIYYKYMVA
jgi:hypothetical protein